MIVSDYENEIRSGFNISSMMKRVWAVQLDILSEIRCICEKYGLSWWIEGGSMLGAVREKGYIPWDDDMDIAMHRLDWEKFLRYAAKELPAGLFIANANLQERDDLVFCVKCGGCIPPDNAYLEAHHGCPYPVGVDIFVYDNIPDDPDERDAYIAVFSHAFTAGKEAPAGMLYDSLSEDLRRLVDKTIELTGAKFDKDKPVKGQMFYLADRIAAMYFDADTEYMAVTPYLPLNNKLVFKRQYFNETVLMPFETEVLPVPIEYEKVLSIWYGDDYMVPKREGADHEYPYFGKFEDQLQKWYIEHDMTFPEEFRA